MTVICWDGKSIAADKLNWAGGNTRITKIRRIRGELYGITGKTVLAQLVWHWIEVDKMKPELMPLGQKDKDEYNTIMRITKDKKILIYENSPTPWENERTYHAIGGGNELAIGALAAKVTAAEAVQIAIDHNALCGQGIDVLEFIEKSKGKKK